MVDCFLRPATENDIDLLYEWVCDEDVRKNSLNSTHIIYDEHKKWFLNKLLSDKVEIFIYCWENKPIGQIRIELERDTATISYSIKKSHRGQGHGENILTLLENMICDKYPHIKKLVAVVKADNIASMKKFEKLNYTKKDKVYKYSKTNLKQLNPNHFISARRNNIIFLTNNPNTLCLFEWLCESEDNVILYSKKIYYEQIQQILPVFIISYNYKYRISNDIIKCMNGKIINLHSSYLPYNKGSNPNFWSFIDDTIKGVTIHQVSEKLDNGDILCQKEVFFDEKKETFVTSYNKLQEELQKLFKDNWANIKMGKIKAFKQIGEGTYHTQNNFLEYIGTKKLNWNMVISKYKKSN